MENNNNEELLEILKGRGQTEQKITIPTYYYGSEEYKNKAIANRLLGIFYVVYFRSIIKGIGIETIGSQYSVETKSAADEDDAIRQAKMTMKVAGLQDLCNPENYEVSRVEKRKK